MFSNKTWMAWLKSYRQAIQDVLNGKILLFPMDEVKIKRSSKMPLVKGKKAKTKKGFSKNVETEMNAGKPQKQAVAIAYSEARRGKKGKK